MMHCAERLEAMRLQVVAQVEALGPLAEALSQEAEGLRRGTMGLRLRRLQEEVRREVDSLSLGESSASLGFLKGKLVMGALDFGVGALAAALMSSREHPFRVGAKLASEALEETAPFGRVLVAIGPKGVPDDVKVVCVSRLARQGRGSEAKVEATLRSDGYTLYLPEPFAAMMDRLQAEVSGGAKALPLKTSQLLKVAEENAS